MSSDNSYNGPYELDDEDVEEEEDASSTTSDEENDELELDVESELKSSSPFSSIIHRTRPVTLSLFPFKAFSW